MKLEKLQKIYLIVGLNFSVIFIVIVTLFSIFSLPEEYKREIVLPVPPELIAGEGTFSAPQTLLIPKIGVEAHVEHVGVALSGNMAVPREYENVGWMRHGPTPGSIGNAVMAGHLDTGSGKSAVFINLKDLKVGDEVFVVNEDKDKLKFVVKKIALVDYTNPSPEAIEAIFGASNTPHLNLITCDGTWIPEEKTYSNRLIVFTEFDGVVEN